MNGAGTIAGDQGSKTPETDFSPVNALSVDVEDYFQVEAFAAIIDRTDWDSFPSRVERNTGRVLELFADHGARATFFVLGWVAEKFPGLIRRIAEAGHEVASHGYRHYRVAEQSPDQYRTDVRITKALLEDIIGDRVRGYRAPSFSIGKDTLWALDILADEGYDYSSSIYPIRHDLYGMPDGQRFAYRPDKEKPFLEVPITTVQAFGRRLPCGGGGFFRLLPYAYSRWAWRRVNEIERQPCIFYFHPWEIDHDQPRQSRAGLKSRLRHYTNLQRMEGKLSRALHDFTWRRLDEVFLSDPSDRMQARAY